MIMEPLEAKKWVKKIVKQRQTLIRLGLCQKNQMLMISITNTIGPLLEANDYSGDLIFSFIYRHYTDILLIIPGNRSEPKNLKILRNICEEWRKKLLTTTKGQQSQLQLQF